MPEEFCRLVATPYVIAETNAMRAAARAAREDGSAPDALDVEKLPVIYDWPEKVPITEAEIQVLERWSKTRANSWPESRQSRIKRQRPK